MATLLGPPELSNYNRKSKAQPHPTSAAATTTKPPMGLTENHSATFLSSGNPCLDFFFHVVPDTPYDSLRKRLDVAWAHNPLTTLKLICNLRGVRGTGKTDREGFYTAATWLFSNHPKTLAANVPSFAEFGYFKDLPEILYRVLKGSGVRKNQKEQWRNVKGSTKRNRLKKMMETDAFHLRRRTRNLRIASNKESRKKKPFHHFLVDLKLVEF
ncbi:hypothetical protein HN51_023795 [Arachis hypogaea]|uniref:DUF2828 domain-containing protein n=1 Tax=Arachis hypogaea TaxID=3818 RepID=A0A445C3L7_ARAHY|nr:hypothetical protein Ahy_A07g031320 [Arachis hypogaea]